MLRGYGGYTSRLALFLLQYLFPLGSKKPPAATTVFFGANDAALAGRTSERQHVPVEEYKDNLRRIVHHLKECSSTMLVVLITPPPVDEEGRMQYAKSVYGEKAMEQPERTNEMSGVYASQCVELARELVLPSINLWAKMQETEGWQKKFLRLLIQLVEQYGVRKWSLISQMLNGRIGKQCRERWHNHLRPNIKKDVWSEVEDKILIEAHAEIGNKWAEIAKRLPGRTENSIKNHWNATKRRQLSRRKCRSKYPRQSTLLQNYIKSLNLESRAVLDYQKNPNANTTMPPNSTLLRPSMNKPELPNFCPTDGVVPDYDYEEVPNFSFDANIFQENCSIDSLLN